MQFGKVDLVMLILTMFFRGDLDNSAFFWKKRVRSNQYSNVADALKPRISSNASLFACVQQEKSVLYRDENLVMFTTSFELQEKHPLDSREVFISNVWLE